MAVFSPRLTAFGGGVQWGGVKGCLFHCGLASWGVTAVTLSAQEPLVQIFWADFEMVAVDSRFFHIYFQTV